jgi:hypothetical protein
VTGWVAVRRSEVAPQRRESAATAAWSPFRRFLSFPTVRHHPRDPRSLFTWSSCSDEE